MFRLLTLSRSFLFHVLPFAQLVVFADINSALQGLAKILLGFVIGALTLAFSYGGYLWMTSHNNPARRSEAYLYMFGAAFGAVAIILAPTIATAINNAINTGTP